MVGISPCFVCHEQYWLVYHRGLSVMDNIGWYISKFFFCRGQYWLVNQPFFQLWTILVCISTGFFVSWTIMADISNGFVCHEQYLLVYRLVMSVMDIIGSLISQFCLS